MMATVSPESKSLEANISVNAGTAASQLLSPAGPGPATQGDAMNPAAKKLQKILDSRFETDKDAISAMQTLSEMMGENTIVARRNLRSDLERRNLATSKLFLHKFAHVRNQIHALAQIVQDISSCCQVIQEELKQTKENTAALIQRTNELNDESKTLSMQLTLTEAFCKKFYLLPEEENLVKNKDFLETQDVAKLLEILTKIKKIHNDAKVLLRTKNQVTGLEIVEKMGRLEEFGFEKLYRWTQRECRNMTSETPEISSLLVRALESLSERKTLLNYTMDEFCMVRKGVVSRGFIDALTRHGGPAKPIEMHAHDPVRYVGYMLAWIHQALASEREVVEILLQKSDCTPEEISFFVSFASEGLCRPLKVRLDHVIANDPDVITMFRIRAYLKFYYSTFSESVSPTSPLCSAMLENAGLFDKLFFSTLKTSLTSLCEQRESVPGDLTPSPALMKIVNLLQQVLDSYNNAFFDPKVKQNDFKTQSASSAVSPADMAVYMMNCLHKAKTSLAVYEFTDEKIEMLSGQIDAHLDTLINEQVVAFLNKTDLMFAHTKQTNNDLNFSSADSDRVKKAANNLDKLLSNTDQFMLPQIRCIISATLRETAVSRSQTFFAQIYADLCQSLTSNGFTELVSNMRNPDQVKSLLT